VSSQLLLSLQEQRKKIQLRGHYGRELGVQTRSRCRGMMKRNDSIAAAVVAVVIIIICLN